MGNSDSRTLQKTTAPLASMNFQNKNLLIKMKSGVWIQQAVVVGLRDLVEFVIQAGWEWPIMWGRVPACVRLPLIGLDLWLLWGNAKVAYMNVSHFYQQ